MLSPSLSSFFYYYLTAQIAVFSLLQSPFLIFEAPAYFTPSSTWSSLFFVIILFMFDFFINVTHPKSHYLVWDTFQLEDIRMFHF